MSLNAKEANADFSYVKSVNDINPWLNNVMDQLTVNYTFIVANYNNHSKLIPMRTNLLLKTLRVFMTKTFYPSLIQKENSTSQKTKKNASEKINTPVKIGSANLKNRFVMVSMNRCRAIKNMPNMLMKEYYRQRTGAGLIITEGTAPSPCGLGYARMPGIFNMKQISEWEKITTAVHNEDAKIFIHLMHTGRISHPLNVPKEAQIIAPSSVKAEGQIWTDAEQMRDLPIPKEMNTKDLWQTKTDFVIAAKNAILAGFDGVELNAANGYLLEQFISPHSNKRKDEYAGNIENRCRFILEIADAISVAIGKEKTAVRLSPYGIANGMRDYYGIDATYKYLAEQLKSIGIAYLHLVNYSTAKTQLKDAERLIGHGHLVDYSATNVHAIPVDLKILIREIFKNSIVLSGNYNFEKAENDIQKGLCDLVAFGMPFINNPDLVDRYKNNWPLSETIKTELFYTDDEKGYTDYPNYHLNKKESILNHVDVSIASPGLINSNKKNISIL
jgi:N-ethylmaleimide reductase